MYYLVIQSSDGIISDVIRERFTGQYKPPDDPPPPHPPLAEAASITIRSGSERRLSPAAAETIGVSALKNSTFWFQSGFKMVLPMTEGKWPVH